MRSDDSLAAPTSGLIRAHTIASLVGLFLSGLFGLLVSIKFDAPGFLGHHAWDTWGRLRYDHTQGILYAWMGNAFIAFLYYAVPRLTQRPVTSIRLGWLMFWVWNVVAVLGGWSLVLAGSSQPLEWAEFPLGIAAVIELALVLLIVQFCIPFWKTNGAELYVAGWYLLGGIIFTTLAYPVGNLLPHLLPGAMGAAFSGLWIHDAVGIFVTPFATAIAYFIIPAVTRKPIYSHFYSMIGFWLLFLVYPLNGIHHYVYSALPMSAQHASEVASIYQGIDVILVVTNLLLSVSLAKGDSLVRDIPLRFVWTSVVLYLVVSIQGSVQAVMAFNSFVHFTDWVIGHSHLAMIGFASFAAMGAIAHIWQSVPGARQSRRMLAWSYWLIVIGLGLMVVDLTGAGLVQASLWREHLPWIDSVRASQPYWVFRSLDGGLLLCGFLAFAASFFVGDPVSVPATRRLSTASMMEMAGARKADRWISTAYGATFGAGLVFFVVSFVALGVIPAIDLHKVIARTTPQNVPLTLTEQERHGQQIYARNGCAYCHTEQVRFTPADEWRFGPPTQAWETQDQYPQMWGTRRIGPDLAREAGRRSRDWQLVHLYNPRFVVPDSMMPAYAWMFDGSAEHPSEDARDLVAYLNTLGRAALAAGSAGNVTLPGAIHAQALHVNLTPNDSTVGRAVFAMNCAGCHGADGRGLSEGGRALRPVAFNLVDFQLTPDAVWQVLQAGVPGSAMPAWNELPGDESQAVAAYVLTLSRTPDLRREEMFAPQPVLQAAGERVFVAHCARCHGMTGDGNGPDAANYQPRPANFHQMLVSFHGAETVIREGVPGSGMPAWPLLTPQETQAVTVYMRSFYEGGTAATSTASHTVRAPMEDMP
ncbi:MAG: cbb3-type cytochrome c oxidase subunit I [Terracidiphilus sp.]